MRPTFTAHRRGAFSCYNYGKTVPNQVIVCKCSGVEDKVAYKERGWYSPPLTGKTLGRPSTKIFSGYCPVRLGTEFIKNTPLLSWTQCHNSGSKRMKNENNNYYNITLFPSLPRVTHSGHIRVIFCVFPVHHSFSVGSINKNPRRNQPRSRCASRFFRTNLILPI